MKWFKHEAAANMDAKLQEVLLDYGLEGYGLYWYCLELIAGKVEPGNLTFELEHDCRIIARNTGSTAQRVQEMMTRFVELGLFENSQGTVTCLKMAKVSDDYTAKLIRSEQSVKKPQVIENKGVLQTPTNSEKVSLEENRTEENRAEENTIGTSDDAPCGVCSGEGVIIGVSRLEDCSHCNVTGKEPTCNDGLQVQDVRNSRTTEKPKSVYPEEFEWIWKNKPERSGSNGKKSAYNACRARIKQGATWRELAEGMQRYAAHCKADGKLNTPYVMQMATFFGPDEHYKNQWSAAAPVKSGAPCPTPAPLVPLASEMTEEQREASRARIKAMMKD